MATVKGPTTATLSIFQCALLVCFKMGQTRPLFLSFRSFHMANIAQNDKSVDAMLGTQTQGDRMVDADESTMAAPLCAFLFFAS